MCITGTPAQRAKDISRGTGVIGKWSVFWSIPSAAPREDERRAHYAVRKYRNKDGGTEVFACPPSVAKTAVLQASKQFVINDAAATKAKEEKAYKDHAKFLQQQAIRAAMPPYIPKKKSLASRAGRGVFNVWAFCAIAGFWVGLVLVAIKFIGSL
jgi:hypothetical protein